VSRVFDRTTRWIVDFPWLTYLLIALISAIAIVGYVNPELVTSRFRSAQNENSTNSNSESTAAPPVEGFSFGADSVLVIQSDQFFSSEGALAMREIVNEFESQLHVRSVTWMDDIPMLNIFSLPQPVLPHSSASEIRFAAAKEKATAHPFIRGQLLSEDATTALLLINFDRVLVNDDSQLIEGVLEIAESVSAKHPEFEAEFSVTGQMPVWITAKRSHDANTFYFQLIGYSMIAIMSIILFRGFAAVLVVALAPSVGVFWTLGIIRFFDYQNNPFNDVVLPVLVSLIALTDGVHLIVEIRKLRSGGLPPKESAAAGIRKVGLACALTSLTTAIGFGSLALANHQFVQEFGICCVVGVILSFIAVVTTIPLACSSWVGKFVQVGQEKSLVDKNLGRIGGVIDYVIPRKKWIAFVGVAATIFFIAVSLTLRPDERQSSIIPASSKAAIGLRKIDEAMNGVETAAVDVTWDQTIESDSGEVLSVVKKVESLLSSEPLIGHPLSIVSLVESLPGDAKTEDRMSMLELLPPSLKRAFYIPERRNATVAFRVRDLGIAAYDQVFVRIQSGLKDLQASHSRFKFDLEGEAVWRWENLFQIVVDLATSLGTAVLIIFVVLAVVYRSLRIGLISLVPNLFPLAVSGVYLVITGQALEVVTVCAFTVCLGIAVDDTIHFLTRYKEELELTGCETEAIRKAFTGVGTALIMTTIVLVSGFGTVLFSDSRDHFIFASMGMITLSAALFADLVFLPAMLAQYSGSSSSTGADNVA
jgi:predicted RND superfamily exporter protein